MTAICQIYFRDYCRHFSSSQSDVVNNLIATIDYVNLASSPSNVFIITIIPTAHEVVDDRVDGRVGIAQQVRHLRCEVVERCVRQLRSDSEKLQEKEFKILIHINKIHMPYKIVRFFFQRRSDSEKLRGKQIQIFIHINN